MRHIFLVLLLGFYGCAGTPTTTPASGIHSLVGNWVGTETATVGESGTLSATFTDAPTDSENAVSVTLTWTNEKITRTYAGVAHGPLDNLVITATDYICNYTAFAYMSPEGTTVIGRYQGSQGGATYCPAKAGSFTLTRRRN
jgi:hypothetical protein